MTDTGARALAHAIIEQAIRDYMEYRAVNSCKDPATIRDEVKRFFASDWFALLCEGAYQGNISPTYIIEHTFKAARAQDLKKARKAVE